MAVNLNVLNDPLSSNSIDLSECYNSVNDAPNLIGTSKYYDLDQIKDLKLDSNWNYKFQTLHFNIKRLASKCDKLKDPLIDLKENYIWFETYLTSQILFIIWFTKTLQ